MNFNHIYTDGSKDDIKVGCAIVSDDFSETMRIPDGSSIFTAEAKAIDLALDLIANCETYNKFAIFSDSLSVLKSLDRLQNIPKFKNYQMVNSIETNISCDFPWGSQPPIPSLDPRMTQGIRINNTEHRC